METTERIVEAYARYIKNWFTIPNIKCKGQYEIDLLAVDVDKKGVVNRYHIESGVSISGSYSRLTLKDFSTDRLKNRLQQAGQRRTLGYFTERKFGSSEVLNTLNEYGFQKDNYKKIIVTWGWAEGVPEAAKKAGVQLWSFQDLLIDISKAYKTSRTYFTDDTMRTLQLMAMASQRIG